MKSQYKVLIVEDQIIAAMEIKQILEEMNLNVVGIAKSNEIAIKKFKEHLADIVIMDIYLEGEKDGISTVEDLYKINDTSIVYLTAFNDDATIDRAIKTNPLAYELKPFNKASLISSIKIVIAKLNKDVNNNREKSFDLGYGYHFNLNTHELYYQNTFIKLGKQEIQLLLMLINVKGQLITQKQIEYEIWGDNIISESSVRTLIYRLRTRFEYKIIETIPYRGIRLILN